MQRVNQLSSIGGVLCSGGLAALAAPGQDFSVLAWAALVPLLLVLRDRGPGSSFWLAFGGGLAANAGIVHWLTNLSEVRLVDFLLIAGYLGFWWGLFGALLALVTRRQALPLVVTAPVLWVCCEYARSHFFFLELPWVLLGHTQYRQTAMIQSASIAGVYGISYLIVFVNAAIADVLAGSRYRVPAVLAALLLLGSAGAVGQVLLSRPSDARSVSVTIVPGNVPQADRWDTDLQEANLNRYLAATRQAIDRSPTALIVWPETSVPGQLRRDLKTVQRLQGLAREGHTSLLIGSADREKFGQGGPKQADRYNSAFIFSPDEPKIQAYQKMKLLPFGEYLPLPNAWFWPTRYHTQSSQYTPGGEYSTFHLSNQWASAPFAVVICWESIFPDHIRPFVQRGAQFLVTISNEAWFSGSAATDQLLAMNVFRAVEFRRTLVRSVNGGLSGFIDPYGRFLAITDPRLSHADADDYLTHTIPVTSVQTLYAEYGDIFAQLMVVLTLAGVCVPLKRAKPALHAESPTMAFSEYFRSR